MNDLVFLQNEQALTTSLKVAEYFGKRHDRVLRAIEDAQSNLPKIGDVKKSFIKSSYKDAKGESRPMYLLTHDGFIFVVMGFTGKKAAELKWNYIQAFNAMERKIIEQLAERKSEEWRAIRQAGKRGNKQMCATILDKVISDARARGSTTPDIRFFQNWQKMINKFAGVKPNSRDELPIGQIKEIEKLQHMAIVSIRGLAARGKDYKQIYQDTKQILENYSRLSLIPERFLGDGYGH